MNHEDELNSNEAYSKIIKGAGVITIAMFASRILGFVRDASIAMVLGAGFYSDAFFAAFRIPDLFRRFFSDGALSISFIPVFTEIMVKDGQDEAFRMARCAIGWIMLPSFVILALIGIVVIFKWHDFDLKVTLSLIMLPYVISLLLMAVFMGVLNSMGHFAAPAMAPIFFNLVMIFVVLVVSPCFDMPVLPMAFGVLAGGLLQAAIQVPFLLKRGFKIPGKLVFYNNATVRAFKTMLPAMLGMGAYQINLLFATFMASLLADGSISYLYYADRLVQFPLALFTVSLSTSLLPELTRLFKSKQRVDASELFIKGIRMAIFMTIPSMAGLIVLREPIAALLFHQGAFEICDVQRTGDVLLFLSLGIWAFSGTRLFLPLFYSLSNFRLPLKAAVASILLNIIVSFFLMKTMGISGLALSISIASILNCMLLFYGVTVIIFHFEWKEIIGTACRSLLLSAMMFILVQQISLFFCPPEIYSVKLSMFLGVFVSVIAGGIFYILGAYFCKMPELLMVLKIVKKQG
ncbi:murein biosynthesis integral membrane protein MurJ [Desulfamplus magnetovallimortis]|uniref:murein biosynthesis integral membrane protein MurJ n=1 Tax=Desulfamplus magnetovallimortis TaxID=1246637 RepID=UPI0016440E3B|nr:murein biosynthesis integral membrane protein MurJ [Desulfamplus magnetovallimortis]